VMLSGNHQKIEEFRLKESLRLTYLRRPDLLQDYHLNPLEKKLLDQIIQEEGNL
jgi:tRNA (guanine37-N1)-methyltransferase